MKLRKRTSFGLIFTSIVIIGFMGSSNACGCLDLNKTSIKIITSNLNTYIRHQTNLLSKGLPVEPLSQKMISELSIEGYIEVSELNPGSIIAIIQKENSECMVGDYFLLKISKNGLITKDIHGDECKQKHIKWLTAGRK